MTVMSAAVMVASNTFTNRESTARSVAIGVSDPLAWRNVEPRFLPDDPRPSASPAPVASPAPRASKVAPLPEAGSGEFLVARGQTPPTGTGDLVTYTVEIERDVPVRAIKAARIVDRVLTDPRGWTATGAHALARVDTNSDIRVLLATPETTDTLCAPLRTAGRLSCRSGTLVVLNAWRWLNGAPAYPDSLRDYRSYLISHEVGHALGNAHVACPGAGQPAPVMMQQTKGLGECVANPWPLPQAASTRLEGRARRLSSPASSS